MLIRTRILLTLNKLFRCPVHPFNLQNDGKTSYAMWQYEKGADTIKNYAEKVDANEMFSGKDVLDIGCGAAGKSMYYASLGAKTVTGMDVVPYYEAEATALAETLGFSDVFRFVLGDAAHMDFPDESFDVIVMNDAMEHVDDPMGVLNEAARVLKKGGRLYLNFPPYNHPYGAHLSDCIGFPWVHVFFSDQVLIEAYKILCRDKPDGDKRIAFRISTKENGEEYFSYINKMTIKRFKKLKENCKLSVYDYREMPLRPVFAPFCKLPILREFLVKMVVVILEKK